MQNETITQNTTEKTALEKVFALFCAKESLNPVMLNPFVFEDRTYATDRIKLVCCDNDKIDFYFGNKEEPLNVKNVLPKINTSEIIHLDKIDWNSLMQYDEEIKIRDEVECGHCGGDGTCDDSVYYNSKFYDYEFQCPVCDGSGIEEEAVYAPTGNKIFSERDKIQFKDIYFFARNFYTLKQVQDIIGGDVELISYNTGKEPIRFFIGILDIVLMPCVVHEPGTNDVLLKI